MIDTFSRAIFLLFALLLTAVVYASPILTDGPPALPTPGTGMSPGDANPIVLDVVLHRQEDIIHMLRRAEQLATAPNPAERPERITLVLHGPEIQHFRISQYNNNREIVDLAAKLDAFNIVDVKMCNTAMSTMGVEREDVPAFVEIVPYGPTEIERLQSEGFIKL